MSPDSDRHTMVEACLTAAEHVNRSGSPALQRAMRVVLYILGCELARQSDSGAHSGEPFARIIGKRLR